MSTLNWTITDINRIKAKQSGEPIAIPVSDTETPFDKSEEKKLQREAEHFLTYRGYIRLMASTAVDAGSLHDARGWFFHVRNTKGEATLFPDLSIFNQSMTRCLMIELKTRGVYQQGQREMIQAKAWIECRSFEAVRVAVLAFEGNLK